MPSQGDLCELDNALNECRARLGHSEKTLQRLLGCAGEIIDDLYAAMKAYQPTVQQLAAVDALFARLRAPRH